MYKIQFCVSVVSVADADQTDGDELTTEYYDGLYCPACDKSFKSDKACVFTLPYGAPPTRCLHLCSAGFMILRLLGVINSSDIHFNMAIKNKMGFNVTLRLQDSVKGRWD